jgi:hypothetical protein
MNPKQRPFCHDCEVAALWRMYTKLYMKNLFAGLTLTPLVRQSITRKSLRRFGKSGRDISPTGTTPD